MEEKLISKGIMRDIMFQRKFALQLIGRGKDYDCLLKYLLAKDNYYEDVIMWPKLIDISNNQALIFFVD